MEEDFRNKYLEQDSSTDDVEASNISQPATAATARTNATSPPTQTDAVGVAQQIVNRTSNATQTLQNNIFQIYQNPTLGIRMQYLTDWKIQEEGLNDTFSGANTTFTNASTIAFFSPLKDSGLSIEVGNIQPQQQEQFLISQNASSQTFLNNSVANLIDGFSKQYPDFQIISYNASSAVHDSGGNIIPAAKVVFSYSSSSPSQPASALTGEQEQQQQSKQFTPQGKRLYGMIVFTAYHNKSYIVEAYSEIVQGAEAQARKYSNNLIAPQQMVNTFEIL
jgi:hypothetical protein